MSRFITYNKDGTMIEEIESMEACKWRINDVCCNDSSEFLGDYYCQSTGKAPRNCFEKEDGIVESDGKPFELETYLKEDK